MQHNNTLLVSESEDGIRFVQQMAKALDFPSLMENAPSPATVAALRDAILKRMKGVGPFGPGTAEPQDAAAAKR